jgi:hypothetical protein
MLKKISVIATIVAVAGMLAAASSQAASSMTPLTATNTLTFRTAVGLPGVTLGAGTYVFEAGPQGTNPNIVRVLSSNRQKQYYLGFTAPRARAQASREVLIFGEAPEGAVTPILVWYPMGSTSGHEFMYR